MSSSQVPPSHSPGFAKDELAALGKRLALPPFADLSEIVPESTAYTDTSQRNVSGALLPLAEYHTTLSVAFTFLTEDIKQASANDGLQENTLANYISYMNVPEVDGTEISVTDSASLRTAARQHIIRLDSYPAEEVDRLLMLDVHKCEVTSALIILAHFYTNSMLHNIPSTHRPAWLNEQQWADLYSQFPIGPDSVDPAVTAAVETTWSKMGSAFADALSKRTQGKSPLTGNLKSPLSPSRSQLLALQSTLATFSTSASRAAIPGALASLMDKYADVACKQFFAFAEKASCATKPEAMLVSDADGNSSLVRAVHKPPSKRIVKRHQLFKAFEMMVRAFTYSDPDFGARWSTDSRSVLGQLADMMTLEGTVQYMDQLLLSVLGHARRQVKAFKKAFPSAEMPTSWPYETIDLELNMQLVQVISARATLRPESEADSSATESRTSDKAAGSPKKKMKPPTSQPDVHGQHSNPVSTSARNMTTSNSTRSQDCRKFSEGQPCVYFDPQTGRCPFKHTSKAPAPGGKKRKRKDKTKKKKKSQPRRSHSSDSNNSDSSS